MMEYKCFSFISPDGNYLMICKGKSISILFKKKDGTWTHSQDITSIIGKTGICPIVTPGGKYLFFIAYIPYWVDASFIEELRKNELNENSMGTK